MSDSKVRVRMMGYLVQRLELGMGGGGVRGANFRNRTVVCPFQRLELGQGGV